MPKLLLSLLFPFVLSAIPAPSVRDLVVSGHADEALHILLQRVQNNPQDAEAYNLVCRVHFQLDQWDAAISACGKAVDLDSQNSTYAVWLGRAYGEKAARVNFMRAAGLAPKVRESFERAVRLDPSNWEARTDLAEFYLEAPGMVGGGREKALAEADALTRLKPAMAHWVQGRIAEKSKDDVTAEREFKAAIATSGGGAHARLNLAIFYLHTKRFDDMEQALQAMENSPLDRPESLTDGASVLMHANRNMAFAERLVRRYLQGPLVEEEPSFKAHTLLGEILEKHGDKIAAAEEFRKALALAHEYVRAETDLKHAEK